MSLKGGMQYCCVCRARVCAMNDRHLDNMTDGITAQMDYEIRADALLQILAMIASVSKHHKLKPHNKPDATDMDKQR